jgi:hypothetical protein
MPARTWSCLIPGHPFLLLIALLTITASSLRAQEIDFKSSPSRARLLELFSSEGCSSCPPAEAWVSRLKDDPGLWTDLFPVVFHVDYWDNLGWPDRFARPAFTQRQQDYAARLGQESVYTPEFIANGHEWRGWFHGEPLPAASTATSGELAVSTKGNGGAFSAIYSPARPNSTYTFNLALLGFNVMTDVQRGENGGRRLQHDFVVLAFASKPLPSDDKGHYAATLDLASATGDAPGAVIAWVTGADGSLVQIAGGWLKK